MNTATLEPPPSVDAPSALVDEWYSLFTLLADRTRLRILFQLSRHDELPVNALCELLALRQPAVSHHLSRLRAAGLIEARRDGKQRFYRLVSDRVGPVLQSLFDSAGV